MLLLIVSRGSDLDVDQQAYLDALPVEERLIRYRQLARDALIQAFRTTDPSARAGLLGVANGWHGLATELEKPRAKLVLPKGTP